MPIKKFLSTVFTMLLLCAALSAQNVDIYPTHWWVGMKWNKLQLLMRSTDDNFSKQTVTINYPGVAVTGTHKFENGKYLAVDVNIASTAKPGNVSIHFSSGNNVTWELKARRKGNGTSYAQGVTSADLIYLIMPDRFSNGDPSNDKFNDMKDTSSDRNSPFLRHGGDLQGITNHLDYFNDLGVTALWLTPVVENDMGLTSENGTMRSTYHGYAFTDQYKIDKRFGGNEAYKQMVDAAHARHIKVIQDAVYNHFGDQHFLFADQPSKDWFNQWPDYTNTTYKDQPLVDRYASKSDYDISVKGWFTRFMPDVNQQNPYMANYLIQYALWAVEEFGIDGWRVDTYFYSDRDFLNKVNEALYREFPNVTIFGETSMQSVVEQAYYMQNNIDTKWKSNLQGVTDFEWQRSALAGVKDTMTWNGGINRFYNTLIQDILYKDPMRNEIFLDNHDLDRFYSVVGEDYNKYKQAMILLLTQRGIPQIYYGTEILMKNFKNPTDAEVRKDFPGGWPGDPENKFVASGRTAAENDAYNFVKALAQFRLRSSAIKTGKFMQYVPVKGVYVYFRYDDKQTIMCVINTSVSEQAIDFSKYSERTGGFNRAVNVFDQTSVNTSGLINIGAQQSIVWQLEK